MSIMVFVPRTTTGRSKVPPLSNGNEVQRAEDALDMSSETYTLRVLPLLGPGAQSLSV